MKLNFLLPESCTQLDSTSLFMLQLACILNMVSVWKRATLRVFLCTDCQDAVENDRRKSRLDDLLTQLRIHALTVLVPIESVRNLINRPIINENDLIHYQLPFTSSDILNASDIYLRAVNAMIRQYSERSALCFLYLPPPPAIFKNDQINTISTPNTSFVNDEINLNISDHQPQAAALMSTTQNSSKVEYNKRYLKMLEIISDALPPCLYVNGVSCVTSTHL